MASGHASRQWLEAFKFTVYLVTPIGATVFLGTGAYPYLEKMIHNTAYIVYPAEGATPPKSAEGIAEKLQDIRKERMKRAKSVTETQTPEAPEAPEAGKQ